jgi:hypothetical protein
VNYPFYVNNEGRPENIYIPPYPHQYYYDNGQSPNEMHPITDQTPQYTSELNNNHHHHHPHSHHHHHHHHNHHQDRPNSNHAPPVPIRRHTPGSTDPTLQQLSSRTISPTPSLHPIIKRNPPKPKPQPPPVRNYTPSVRNYSPPVLNDTPTVVNYSPVSLDPDERPIRPMKNASVYHQPSSPKKITQPRKPFSPPKPIQSSPRYESDTFQPPPSRTPMSNASVRRPIRTDLIPNIPVGIPPQRSRSRRVIIEEYDDHDDYPVSYVNPVPQKVISYQEVPGMTTREMENYQLSKVRRIVRVRSPPIRTIIYRP